MEGFDIERFIAEVEARPAIWDSRKEVYSDRDKRYQAWNELCIKFVPDFSEKNKHEKNHVATQMQRRWKSLRDCFKREHTKQLKEQTRVSSVPSVRKPYKYYQNLSFLIHVTETKGDNSSPAVQDDKESSDVSSMEKQRKRKKMFLENSAEESEQELPPESQEPYSISQGEAEEGDRNFALSLLPHFKQISQDYKLDAQMEILMVLKKYKSFGRQLQVSNVMGSQESIGKINQPTTFATQFKLSPASTEDGQQLTDDSSINENIYF